MGYLHIENLYANQTVLMFPEVYVLEKIHGTSAHISWGEDGLKFFSGGVKQDAFEALFDKPTLEKNLYDNFLPSYVFYGEAYGGKCQKMSHVYGPDLKFVVFDVKFCGDWVPVPIAEQLARKLGLEFVHYVKIAPTMLALDAERDAHSKQAWRNGMGAQYGEGVVIRPVVESNDHRGNRIIAKHKRAEHRETKSIRDVDPARHEILTAADKIAEEYVTETRLDHVLQKTPGNTIKDTGHVVKAMVEDVMREADNVVWSKDVSKAVSHKAAMLFKRRVYASGH